MGHANKSPHEVTLTNQDSDMDDLAKMDDLTKREFHMLIAACRMYQCVDDERVDDPLMREAHDFTASCNEEFEPMTSKEVEEFLRRYFNV